MGPFGWISRGLCVALLGLTAACGDDKPAPDDGGNRVAGGAGAGATAGAGAGAGGAGAGAGGAAGAAVAGASGAVSAGAGGAVAGASGTAGTVECPTGQVPCGDTCVDTATSSEHCGECDAACPTGVACVDGTCACEDEGIVCDGACTNILTSPDHCGACGAACAMTEMCAGGTCAPACSDGLTSCDGVCVDTDSDEAHCGDCDTECPAAQSCTAGECTCPANGTLCGDSCVDTQTDEAHCGDCDAACLEGQSCTAGTCSCPTGLEVCALACVDTQTSAAHCGECGVACTGGRICNGGDCECAAGQVECSGTCADLTSNAAHCGACGEACNVGQSCTASVCTGAGGVGLDGCMGGTALNVTISRIDALQTVAITTMNSGSEVAAANRNADLVQGRDTLFRVFVTPGSGWVSRELSARVTVVNGPASDEYYAKRTVSSGSTESNINSTFQVLVPAKKMASGTSYHVELVECGTPAGTLAAPRFPASGDLSLGARNHGPLKVKMVPILSNSRLPDTSEASLASYRDILLAMYPLTNVEITVGSQISAPYPFDWGDTLDAVRDVRDQEQPPADVYYYGLIAPTATFRDFCLNGCTAGLGYVLPSVTFDMYRVAMGIGFVDAQSYDTFAHELGHNHGRDHAPCVWQGGTIEGVDPDYPYQGALLGVWGYDPRSRTTIDPTSMTDLMSYCDPSWISDYNYDAIAERIAAVNGTKIYVNPNARGRFRVLLADAQRLRWGAALHREVAPSGHAETAEVLDVNGNVLEQIVVYSVNVSLPGAESILVPERRRGWVALRLGGRAPIAF